MTTDRIAKTCIACGESAAIYEWEGDNWDCGACGARQLFLRHTARLREGHEAIVSDFQRRAQTAAVDDLPALALEFRQALTSPYDLGASRQTGIRNLLTQFRGRPVPEGWPRLPLDAPLPEQIP